jgi:sporulation protein YlmC with PRC-barrel domain
VKNFTVAVLMASLTLPLALDASAQMRQAPSNQGGGQTWQHPQGVVESDKLIGASIKGPDGKDLGEVDALLVDAQEGKVSHVVVGRGGLAGIGATKVVVPWSDVKVSWERDASTPTVTMDQTALDKAPRYERRRAGDQPPAASPATGPSTPGTEGDKQKKY